LEKSLFPKKLSKQKKSRSEPAMKILPFHPPEPSKGSEKPNVPGKADKAPKGSGSFASALQSYGIRAQDRVISQNKLASQGASPEDVGAAGTLLSQLLGQVKAASPQALEKVHDLGGILCYYQLDNY
jgi:hypothetical protein